MCCLVFRVGGCLLLALAVAGCHSRPSRHPAEPAQAENAVQPVKAPAVATRSAEPTLPETTPPPGLPIVPWGKRDFFPVIRQPTFVTAAEGDRLLAIDEPVLGLVLNGEARAYSTNQLNRHEMVIDEVAGVPILVTY